MRMFADKVSYQDSLGNRVDFFISPNTPGGVYLTIRLRARDGSEEFGTLDRSDTEDFFSWLENRVG